MPTLESAPNPAQSQPTAQQLAGAMPPVWGVAMGGFAGLVVIGSVPVQLVLSSIWHGMGSLLLAPSARAGVAPGAGIVLWFLLLWAIAFAGLGASLAQPVSRRRLAAIAGSCTAALVACALLARTAMGYWVDPILPLAFLLGGLSGRMIHEQWEQLRARRKAELKRQFNQAVQQMKAEHLMQIAKDLRTPVNAVLGVADLLTETGLDGEQMRHLDVFKRSADTLTRLLEDLDELARIESGRSKLHLTPFSLVPLIHQQIAQVKPRADAKGLQIKLTLAAGLPRTVHGDPARLAQVIAHLLSHSVKVTRQGSVHVEVRPHSRDAGRLRFAFYDTSLSTETGKLASIVEPFAATGASSRAGANVALTLAQRQVEMMGGRLAMRRAAGKGSTVVLSVPLATHEDVFPASSSASMPLTAAAEAALETTLPKVSVLLVDDNVSTRHLIESMLDPHRFSVVSCANGREALQTLDVSPYDVVLMDLDMPEVDGWTAIRVLRRLESERNARRTPVVALGTAPFELERQRCLDAGFDQHLCKPLRKSRLIESIIRLSTAKPELKPPPSTTARTGVLRYDQRDSLSLLGGDGLIDVRTAVEKLGGDATLYLDAIEHLAPALSNWPTRFRESLARGETERARQMALDMQGILEVVGAQACAASLGCMAETLATSMDRQQHEKCLSEVDEQLRPVMLTLQAAVERIRFARQDRSRREQGHNSAF